MAADSPSETFADIDWDSDDVSGTVLSARDKGLLGTLGVLALFFLYDLLLVPDNTPTIPDPVAWNVTQLDWLFMVTLICGFFYVIMPLYQNQRLTRYYWREFKKNRVAVLSLLYLIVIFFIGTIGPMLLKKPELALTQQYQPPVFTTVDASIPIRCVGEVSQVAGNRVCHGSWQHPLGTTGDGKDILVLLIFGMDVSMKIGLIVPLIVITIGTSVGTVAAYAGGLVDEVLMRYVDIQATFPAFFLYLMLIYLFGGSLFMFIVIFGFFGWEGIARLVRSEALQRTEEEYIQAAKSAGGSTSYVIRRHLVPNVSNTVITATTLLIPGFILFEASLSFLSLGDPTVPSWGAVIAAGRNDLRTAWWISTFPGILLFFTILAFNFMGDALGDALDPRRGD
ncbi:MAG: ABC transporter permease [Haloarculaceae archaeon]